MNERQRKWLDNLRELARSRGGTCLSRVYRGTDSKLQWRCAEGHQWHATAHVVRQGRWCSVCVDPYAAKRARAFASIQEIARAKGGLCLSTEYVDYYTYLRWRCAEGHEWDAPPGQIGRGAWCRACAAATRVAGIKARAFANVLAIAREKGGRCLSSEYVNCYTHLRWRCAEGHEWSTKPATIQEGSWCPICASATLWDGEKARVFASVQAIARERGGLCLSTEYLNNYTHLRFRCAEGHEWEATPGHICNGRWCPRCLGRGQTIDDMHELARTRGGRCLSRSFKGTGTHLRWRCAEGHEWTATPSNVRCGTWCPYCAGKARKTIADVQAMAAENGGTCLSTTIKSCRERLRFRCRVGHEFESTAVHLRRGGWCPRCRKAPRGTLERLRGAARRRGGVILDTEYPDGRSPVRVRCGEGHEWTTSPTNLMSGHWCRECAIASSRGRSSTRRLSIAQMQEVAVSRGGRCLSDTYVNVNTPLRWQCHDGHEWDAPPSSIRGGHWCPLCANRYRGTIDGMRALAAARGGRCRSRVYQNHLDVLRFTCARGHEFTSTGMSVKSGVWCPTCGE